MYILRKLVFNWQIGFQLTLSSSFAAKTCNVSIFGNYSLAWDDFQENEVTQRILEVFIFRYKKGPLIT